MADAPMATLRRSSLADGVLALRIDDLPAQLGDVNADLEDAARAGGVTTVELSLVYNNRGWRSLPPLFRRIFRLLPITALRVTDAVDIRFSIAVMGEPHGDDVARALGQVERPPRVRALALLNSMLTDDGFERLGPFLPGLARLDLDHNNLEDGTLRRIAGHEGLDSLEHLTFRGNQPTPRGVRALASDGTFPVLAHLDLSKCKLVGESVRRLIGGNLAAVTELILAENPCGDEGATALAESEWSVNLERLDLSTCGIADAGALALAASPSLRSVGLLDLRGNTLTDAARKRLHDRFGSRVLTGSIASP